QLEPGRRGMVTGLKQTGPQVGSFLSGALAPWGAATIGWRPTVLVIGALMAAAVPLVLRIIPVEDGAHIRAERDRSPLTPGIGWVAVYGTLIGLGGSATFLLPLFVEESLGQSPRVAGAAAALLGAVAIAGRFQWARIAERRASPAPTMALLAAASVVAMAAMLVSIEAGTAWMWIGTVILGLSASSWTAVAAISVIGLAGPVGAGRASGIVWLGFLAGLGIGPPIYGFTVDESGSYALMWWLALVAFALATAVAAAWIRTARPDGSPT
ncbi:MAG: MFS transporter, partial [Acidimicrobiia bacterium]|nr:MFS transporter [Acidimicrobiia bacterium]